MIAKEMEGGGQSEGVNATSTQWSNGKVNAERGKETNIVAD